MAISATAMTTAGQLVVVVDAEFSLILTSGYHADPF